MKEHPGKIHIFNVTRSNLREACEAFNRDASEADYRSSVERIEPNPSGLDYMIFVRIVGSYPFMLNEAMKFTIEGQEARR
jgi:hypothetical protein